MTFKRSPINYMGGKFRSLKYIQPQFPIEIDTFYDVFGGSGTVSLNTEANSYYYNDKITPLTSLFQFLTEHSADKIYEDVVKLIQEYQDMDEEGYLALRKEYNQNPTSLALFTLSQHSFNFLIRFNKSGGFNASFGKGKCRLGNNALEKLKGFEEHFYQKNVTVDNLDFDLFLKKYENQFTQHDFIYFDPPYEITQANYNESRGFTGWTQEDAQHVREWLDKLTERKIPWGYSNSVHAKGFDNNELMEWIKERPELSVFYKEGYFSGIPSTRKNKNKDIEVFITNTQYLKEI